MKMLDERITGGNHPIITLYPMHTMSGEGKQTTAVEALRGRMGSSVNVNDFYSPDVHEALPGSSSDEVMFAVTLRLPLRDAEASGARLLYHGTVGIPSTSMASNDVKASRTPTATKG